MVDESGEVKLEVSSNVIAADFGHPEQPKDARYQGYRAVKLSRTLTKNMKSQDSIEKAVGGTWFDVVLRFFGELGFGLPSTDIDRKAKILAENLKLQEEIEELRGQVNEEMGELRHRAENLKHRAEQYVNVAETCGEIVVGAEYFVASNLLRIIKGRKK